MLYNISSDLYHYNFCRWVLFIFMDQNFCSNDNNLAKDSPEMRAWRLKRIRNLANLTRDQMCEDGQINRNTLISWENARFGGLTQNGAVRIVAKVMQEGVYTTLDWLMHGLGAAPSVNPIPLIQENNSSEYNENLIIAYELAFFKAKNLNAVDFIVDDEGMLPQYKKTDVVAGKKRTEDQIQCILGRDCIVQTECGETLLRNIREGKDSNTFTLICTNPDIQMKRSILLDVKLVYAAPVIWHRRKDYKS